jgi:hypothetical protein
MKTILTVITAALALSMTACSTGGTFTGSYMTKEGATFSAGVTVPASK